jgi:hypothetical protein
MVALEFEHRFYAEEMAYEACQNLFPFLWLGSCIVIGIHCKDPEIYGIWYMYDSPGNYIVVGRTLRQTIEKFARRHSAGKYLKKKYHIKSISSHARNKKHEESKFESGSGSEDEPRSNDESLQKLELLYREILKNDEKDVC